MRSACTWGPWDLRSCGAHSRVLFSPPRHISSPSEMQTAGPYRCQGKGAVADATPAWSVVKQLASVRAGIGSNSLTAQVLLRPATPSYYAAITPTFCIGCDSESASAMHMVDADLSAQPVNCRVPPASPSRALMSLSSAPPSAGWCSASVRTTGPTCLRRSMLHLVRRISA